MADADIGSIINSLSGDDIEKLKSIATGILGSSGDSAAVPVSSNALPSGLDKALPGIDLSSLGLPDMSQLSALAPVISAFGKHDERSDFIMALKPLLSDDRRKKADEAVKIIKLLSVLPLLREQGIM